MNKTLTVLRLSWISKSGSRSIRRLRKAVAKRDGGRDFLYLFNSCVSNVPESRSLRHHSVIAIFLFISGRGRFDSKWMVHHGGEEIAAKSRLYVSHGCAGNLESENWDGGALIFQINRIKLRKVQYVGTLCSSTAPDMPRIARSIGANFIKSNISKRTAKLSRESFGTLNPRDRQSLDANLFLVACKFYCTQISRERWHTRPVKSAFYIGLSAK